SQLSPINPEGYPFIGAFALASLILFWLWTPLGWIGTLLTLWCAYFFRDPPRVTPIADRLIVSPADGRISLVANAVPPPELAPGRVFAARHRAARVRRANLARGRNNHRRTRHGHIQPIIPRRLINSYRCGYR